jgi:hypothetical protein
MTDANNGLAEVFGNLGLFNKSGARFSGDSKYRYTLFRERAEGSGTVNFIMLNPSTADAQANDPTVERCQRRAWAMGYKRLVVTNIFALRSTDPKNLYSEVDPVGLDNDYWLVQVALTSDKVVCAWGSHGNYRDRGGLVERMLREQHIDLWQLRLTKKGEPSHPLYIPYNEEPKPWIL